MCGDMCSRLYLGIPAEVSITQFFKKYVSSLFSVPRFILLAFGGKHSTLGRLSVELGKSEKTYMQVLMNIH